MLSRAPERMSFVASFLTEVTSCVSENTRWPSSQRYLNTTWTYRCPNSQSTAGSYDVVAFCHMTPVKTTW